jgi:hypothetical protein
LKTSQYQMFEIDRKFIHLIIQHRSIWILLMKEQKEQ